VSYLLFGNRCLSESIFLFKYFRVFTKVLANFLLLIVGKKGSGARSPKELFEFIKKISLQLRSFEVPDSIAILGLRIIIKDTSFNIGKKMNSKLKEYL